MHSLIFSYMGISLRRMSSSFLCELNCQNNNNMGPVGEFDYFFCSSKEMFSKFCLESSENFSRKVLGVNMWCLL